MRAAGTVLGAWLTLAGCETVGGDVVLLDAPRCSAPLPPASMPPITVDPHRAAFFAAHPLPLLVDHGGLVVRNPRIVAVFFGDDPLQRATEALLQTYGCSTAFREAVAEYGVGDALYERSVVVPAFPDVAGDAGFRTWLQAHWTTFGPLDENSVLFVFAPTGRELAPYTCEVFGGYHSWVAPPSMPYAFVNGCARQLSFGATALEQRTDVTTHELIELALDPALDAWSGLDRPGWADPLRGESADLCINRPGPPSYPFATASAWSNRRARAGLDPCTASDAPFAIAMPRVAVVDVSSGQAYADLDVYADDPNARYALSSDAACVVPQIPPGATYRDGDSVRVALPLLPGCTPSDGDAVGFSLFSSEVGVPRTLRSALAITGARPPQ